MRTRAITIILATMTGTVLALWLVLRFLWLSQLQAQEAISVHKDLSHAGMTLGHSLATMEPIARERAYRDSAYEYMQTRSHQYERENFAAGSWEELELDFVLLCDTRGRMLVGRGYDPKGGRWLPVPQSLLAEVRPGRPLHAAGDRPRTISGVLSLPEGPMLVVSCPVLRSDRTGPSRGAMVLGRRLDPALLARLAKLSGLVMSVHPYSEAPRLIPDQKSLSELQAGLPVVRPMGRDRVMGYAPVRDLQGEPVLLLGVDLPRTVYRSGVATMGYTLLAFLFIGGVLALTVARVLEAMVLSRLARLIAEVDHIGANVESRERVTVSGRDELAALSGAVNAMLDANQKSREELAAGERRFRDIALHSSDWIWEVDAEGRHTFCSDRVTEVLGCSPDELLGKPLAQIVAPEQAEWVAAVLSEAMGRREPLKGVEFWARAQGGDHVAVQLSGAPVLGPADELLGYRGVGQDVTAQRRAEEAQRLAAIGELAGGVAHEFNNLLTSMSMSAEFAALSSDADRVQQLVQTVLGGTTRGAEICRNLLRFARPEEPKWELLWLADPIAAALSMAQREIANAGLTVHLDQTGTPRAVYGDALQLEQVLLNLILNACQNSPEGGGLSIAAAYEPGPEGHGEVVVTVADQGKGIAPEHLPRVFEPFFTTRGSTELGYRRGTGLGLAVVHSIIGAHGGSIAVRSQLGAGATFEIRLRTHEGTPAGATREAVTAPLPLTDHPHRGRAILVADDEPEIREMLCTALERCGHQATGVASADEVEVALRARSYDVIVTDLLMPGGGGWAVLQLVASLAAPPRVVVMTGRGEPDVVEEVRQLGAHEVVQKPFSIARAVEAVHRALGDQPPE